MITARGGDHRGEQAGGARARAGPDRSSRALLNAAEIDAVISQALALEALAAEQGRRAVWRQITERVAETSWVQE